MATEPPLRLAPVPAAQIPASPLGLLPTASSPPAGSFIRRTARLGVKWLGLAVHEDAAALRARAQAVRRRGMIPFLWGAPEEVTLAAYRAVARHPRPLLRHVVVAAAAPPGTGPAAGQLSEAVTGFVRQLRAVGRLSRPYIVLTLPGTASRAWLREVVTRLRSLADAWLLTPADGFLAPGMAAAYRVVGRHAPRSRVWLLVEAQGPSSLVRDVVRGAALQPERILLAVGPGEGESGRAPGLWPAESGASRTVALLGLLLAGRSRLVAWQDLAQVAAAGGGAAPLLQLDAFSPFRSEIPTPGRGMAALVVRGPGSLPPQDFFLAFWPPGRRTAHRAAEDQDGGEVRLQLGLKGVPSKPLGCFHLPDGAWQPLGQDSGDLLSLSLPARPIFLSPAPLLPASR